MSLNRAERRKYAKQGGVDADQLKRLLDVETKRLEEKFREETHRITKNVTDMYLIAMAHILNYKWGWGRVRIERMLEQIEDVSDSMLRDYVDIIDLREDVLKETGIRIGDDEMYRRKVKRYEWDEV